MRWEAWLLIALQVVGALGSVAMVGKPRKPITGGQAAFTVILSAACVWVVWRLAHA